MKALCFLLVAACYGQNNQSSPLDVRPNAARNIDGILRVRDRTNVKFSILKFNGLDYSSAAGDVTITGSSTVSGNIILTPGNITAAKFVIVGGDGLKATSANGPALMGKTSVSTSPDIADVPGTVGIFLNRAGAPTGTCSNGSLWLRNNGAAGLAGYYCIATAWVAIW